MGSNLNREYRIDTDESVSIKIGTTDRLNPRVIYINYRAWVEADEKADYTFELNALAKTLKTSIRREFANNGMFDRKYILDFDANGETFTKRKKKCLDMTVYLKQTPDKPVGIGDMVGMISNTVVSVSKKIENNITDNGFSLKKRKCSLQKS